MKQYDKSAVPAPRVKPSILFIALLLTISMVFSSSAEVDIIPQPDYVGLLPGDDFVFTPETSIEASKELEPLFRLLDTYLSPAFGFHLSRQTGTERSVVLKTSSTLKGLGEEGYSLVVDSNKIYISAYRPAGIFHGIQTLRQLLPVDVLGKKKVENVEWKVPCVLIEDIPRFKWRGVMLDVSRHFMPVEFIKKQIDLMALYKLNRFHWHLVDDQGWRIEIKKYPKLTEVGAWRDEISDEKTMRYGGFYTQDQIREVVQYAKDRFVEIVPEIEVSGHSSAAIAAYPWLSCKGEHNPIDVPSESGIFKNVYCAGNEKVVEFNQNVLKEIIELFPCKYIHIGGSDALKGDWKSCFRCRSRIAVDHLDGERGLQNYFLSRIQGFLLKNDRSLIGWDEIMEDGSVPLSALMCRESEKSAVLAARQGHDVVMSPHNYCDFDNRQIHPADESAPYESYKSYVPLDKVYSYNPMPVGLLPEEQKHVLGVQATAWTEHAASPEQVEYMLWPRLCALAEVGWTRERNKDIESFYKRLASHYAALEMLNVRHCPARPEFKPRSKDTLRVMTYNIAYGGSCYAWVRGRSDMSVEWPDMGYSTMTGNRFDAIVDVIKKVDPDVVFMQECTGWCDGNYAILRDFAARLDMFAAVTPPTGDRFEVVVLSRYPMTNLSWNADSDPFSRNYLYAEITPRPDVTIGVASAHLYPWAAYRYPDDKELAEKYLRQRDSLLQKLTTNSNKLFVVGGDWNQYYNDSMFHQKPLFNYFEELGYVDGCKSVYGDYENIMSCTPQPDATRNQGPGDCIFISPALSATESIVDADIVYSRETFRVSDHLPVWIDISIKQNDGK